MNTTIQNGERLLFTVYLLVVIVAVDDNIIVAPPEQQTVPVVFAEAVGCETVTVAVVPP
jgi:hypothetical protein